jgi:hypothetical protein
MTNWNVGDKQCPVLLYFDFGTSKILDLCCVKSNIFDVNDATMIIVGGGQVLAGLHLRAAGHCRHDGCHPVMAHQVA